MYLQNMNSFATAKRVFYLLAFVQLIIMLSYSFEIGISADEFLHHEQAEKVYNYYQSNGEDKAALKSSGIDPLHYNGQSFDNVMYAIQRWFKVDNYMDLRHFFNALTGWLIILIAGLIMKEMLGYRAAIVVLLVMFFSPRFFGHALNNNKDIPFAMGFILSIYGMLLYIRNLPRLHWKAMLITTFGIGLSISIRMAGLLSVFFLCVSAGVCFFSQQPLKDLFKPESAKLFGRIAISVIGMAVVGYGMGILTWPFMLEGPVKNLSEILGAISTHPITLNQLFEGKLYASTELPWYYTVKYILIAYPVFVLVGLFLSLFTLYYYRKKVNHMEIFTILFPWLFVVVWMSLGNSNVYGGIRHITFVYPLAVISAVTSFTLIYRNIRKKNKPSLMYGFIGAMALLTWHPVVHMIKNHRYSYVYYNEFAGGIKNAYANYEFDYFFHSMREASEWVIKEIKSDFDFEEDSIAWVGTSHKKLTSYYLRDYPNMKARYVEYQRRGEFDWDYGIFVNTYIYPHQLLHHTYPPKNTVHTITVNKKPICAVLKRRNFYDLKAHQLRQSGNMPDAITYLHKAVEADPNYEWAWAHLMGCYFYTNQFHKALKAGNQFLRCNGNDERALLYIALSYLRTNQVDQSISHLKEMLKLNEKNAVGYYYLAMAYNVKKEYNKALANLKKTIRLDPENKRAYRAMATIYRKLGNNQMARTYYELAQ